MYQSCSCLAALRPLLQVESPWLAARLIECVQVPHTSTPARVMWERLNNKCAPLLKAHAVHLLYMCPVFSCVCRLHPKWVCIARLLQPNKRMPSSCFVSVLSDSASLLATWRHLCMLSWQFHDALSVLFRAAFS